MAKRYELNVYAMPEFLSLRTADKDFSEMPVIVGSAQEADLESVFPGKQIVYMQNSEAELLKYTHNVFAALKINYFNTIHYICKKMVLNYDQILTGLFALGRVEKEHTAVPGPDGRCGFGGACFPKDLEAFIRFQKRYLGSKMHTFESIRKENQYFRTYG
jgi:UDPglucose 6-dehydrogenase